MVTSEQFSDLLGRLEGETMDFKRQAYDLSKDQDKLSLVKDVVSMANTPREHTSYIVMGVKKHPDGRTDLIGLSSHPDEADLQSQFSDRVHPVPRFSYEIIHYEDKSFGIIVIPPEKIGPCMPIRDYGAKLRQRQIYFRRGSKNETPGPDDVNRISRWIQSNSSPHDRTAGLSSEYPSWETLIDALHDFSPERRYLLVTNMTESQIFEQAETIGAIDWSFVFDFDPKSDESGLLNAVRARLELRRHIHLVVKGNRPTLNLERGTYWYFAQGLTGPRHSETIDSWKQWRELYGTELRNQIVEVAKASIPIPISVVALWYGDGLVAHLESILDDILAVCGSSAEFVIAADSSDAFHGIVQKMECALVPIPLHHLCSGFASVAVAQAETEESSVVFPSSSGAPIILESSDTHWIEEEIELIHLNSGAVRDVQRDVGIEFLKGKEITWYELGLRYDIARDQTVALARQVVRDLRSRRGVRINLFHSSGAGGTTIARRVLWDLHTEFPSGVLRRTTPRETVERLQRIVGLTGRPVLLLSDGSDISNAQMEELFEYILARHLPVVILQVLRRFDPQQRRERTVYLESRLTNAECDRFVHVLGREAPKKRSELGRVATTQPGRFHTPFFYCLQAFGRDFVRLDSYVESRLLGLTDVQQTILIFLSIAHHYGHKAIPAQAFWHTLHFPEGRQINLEGIFSSGALDLVVETSKGLWRVSHDLIATEILEHLLSSGSIGRENWRQSLSRSAVAFSQFCRGVGPIPSDYMLEVVRRTFVYRDNIELLGTERSASRQFSLLVRDIPVKEGRLVALKALAEHFPDEPHFWAHLGRFYALEIQDFEEFVACLDRALLLTPNDSVIHHMKGMGLRSHTIQLIEERAPLPDVIRRAMEAGRSFEFAREINPDDAHGYISEVQLICRVLDYAGAQHRGGLTEYLSERTADSFVQSGLERSETLLEHVRRSREGEGPSTYEQDCRGKLDSLYGRHERALEVWGNLLDRNDVYSPPIRRQIVWTYLARKGRSWDELTSREVERAAKLLEDNLDEEPNNDRNMRMWIQAIRRVQSPPSIESVIERVSYWQANSGSIEAAYYLYVLNSVLSLEGSILAKSAAERILEACRNQTRMRRNRTKSFEWIGSGGGLRGLVHHSRLGEWDRSSDFWTNVRPLGQVEGRIVSIRGSEAGRIEVEGGMSAFFVPAKGGFSQGRSENQAVSFHLGFSYDGLRAWNVRDA